MSFRFGVFASLIFLIYCIVLSLKCTNNSLRHSGAILKNSSFSSFSYKQTWERKIYIYTVWTSPFFSMGGEVNFNVTSAGGEEFWKIQKRGGSMVQGQIFLKEGDWHISYLIFLRFIIFRFRNYFILCKFALYVALCYHNFTKKSNLKL